MSEITRYLLDQQIRENAVLRNKNHKLFMAMHEISSRYVAPDMIQAALDEIHKAMKVQCCSDESVMLQKALALLTELSDENTYRIAEKSPSLSDEISTLLSEAT